MVDLTIDSKNAKDNNEVISIITRTTGSNFFFLDRAIFSIYCNCYDFKEVIIIYQGIDDKFFDSLKIFKNLYPEISFKLIQNKTQLDERAKNMNLGISNATGRYLAFLDDDDMLTQNHFSDIINQIKDSPYVWAYSGCDKYIYQENYLATKQNYSKKSCDLYSLLFYNSIPIHSFIIDLLKIQNRTIILTDEKLTRCEDHFMLLNLMQYYRPLQIKSQSAIYNIYRTEDPLLWQESQDILNIKRLQVITEQNLASNNSFIKMLYYAGKFCTLLIGYLFSNNNKKPKVIRSLNKTIAKLRTFVTHLESSRINKIDSNKIYYDS
jgi:hypothetical protein